MHALSSCATPAIPAGNSYTLGPLQAGAACCDPVPLLRVEHLSLAYHGQRALDDVSLDIYRGCITALIGPSGCGKTSFLASLNRLTDLIPGSAVVGRIRFGDIDVRDPAVDVQALRRQIGMIFQKPNPFPLSIRRNREIPLREHGVRSRAAPSTRSRRRWWRS